MKKSILLLAVFFIQLEVLAQKKDYPSSISASGGPFIVGQDYGIWLSASYEKKFSLGKKDINKLSTEAELYFENATDKVTVYNPTPQQFIKDRFYHESNSGLVIKLNYYPFNKIIKGFHVGAGPVLAYSLITYEKRAQLIQYSPNLSIRMSEMTSEKKILAGYRITAAYDIYFSRHFFSGIRADFLQYTSRDLNSLLGLKAGYLF